MVISSPISITINSSRYQSFLSFGIIISPPTAIHSELDFHGHSGIDAISYPVVGSINNCDSITGKSQIKSGDLQLTTCRAWNGT
ncbi:hypothetical protein [Photobacterium leiognathi]|uniref:hypothetical protein n=1 Tax=Photobacterium leiognathi TaxID=553611 RepID=UPI0027398DB9|nr:hypothetical protein [Photobacterium leiognathi]